MTWEEADACWKAARLSEDSVRTITFVTCLAALVPVARWVFSRLLFEPLSKVYVQPFKQLQGRALLAQRSQFRESAWKLLVYSGLSSLSVAVVWQAGWLQDTTAFWKGWPHHEHSAAIMALYYAELAFYIASAFMLAWWEARRRDFYVMMLHHFVTAALIALSLKLNFLRVGVVIMGLHDLCDVLMEASKLAKYAGRDGAATVLFVSFAAAWAALRLSFFPRTVLVSTRYEIVEVLGERPPCLGAFNAMLMALLAMHCYWFLLILRVAWRRIQAGEIQDSRED